MSSASFATVINCMDGRTQIPVIEFIRKNFHVEFVDTVTEPGPVGVLSARRDPFVLESLRKRVAISVEKHGSRVIAIVAHHDCAGNPVDEATQIRQVAESLETVHSWGFPAKVVPLWVGNEWTVRYALNAWERTMVAVAFAEAGEHAQAVTLLKEK